MTEKNLLFVRYLNDHQALSCYQDYVVLEDTTEGVTLYLDLDAAQSIISALQIQEQILDPQGVAFPEAAFKDIELEP